MFCRKCGQKNPDDSNFCESCGTPFGGTQEAVVYQRRNSPSRSFQAVSHTGTVPRMQRSLTSEFRAFSLDISRETARMPTAVERLELDDIPTAHLSDDSRETQRFTARIHGEMARGTKQKFSELRPSEILWILDGVVTQQFDDELALIPGRRFLHVKLMEGEEERYYRPYSAGYWEAVRGLCEGAAPPDKGRRISVFHRPTDTMPGLPFMAFGVDLELGDSAGRDEPSDRVKFVFRSKYYYSGRESELREALIYPKPYRFISDSVSGLLTRVGRPLAQGSRVLSLLGDLAGGDEELVERVQSRLAKLRDANEHHNVALATELYGVIVGVQVDAQEARILVADNIGLLPLRIKNAPSRTTDGDGFEFTQINPRMGVLVREHTD
ncbi:MAG: zinc ribbon domain-containing protein [bacterium]